MYDIGTYLIIHIIEQRKLYDNIRIFLTILKISHCFLQYHLNCFIIFVGNSTQLKLLGT